ncbi:MAG: hypothetical protein ACRDYA_12090 [Egibacteraceae bacterium]
MTSLRLDLDRTHKSLRRRRDYLFVVTGARHAAVWLRLLAVTAGDVPQAG